MDWSWAARSHDNLGAVYTMDQEPWPRKLNHFHGQGSWPRAMTMKNKKCIFEWLGHSCSVKWIWTGTTLGGFCNINIPTIYNNVKKNRGKNIKKNDSANGWFSTLRLPWFRLSRAFCLASTENPLDHGTLSKWQILVVFGDLKVSGHSPFFKVV